VRPDYRVTTGIAADRNRWRRFIQRPAGCFVAARDTAQEHPILLELQHAVVAVQPAKHLAHAVDDAP
jgi:hypothetical protein